LTYRRCKNTIQLFTHILTLYVLFAVMGFSCLQAAPTKKVKSPVKKTAVVAYAPITLHDYITTVCTTHCVAQEELLTSVSTAAYETGADVKTLLAIIRLESSFSKRAKNGSSVGLMQVHLKYHRSRFTSKNYYDVEENVAAGAAIYGECLKKHNGNRTLSLRCYNGYSQGNPAYLKKFNQAYAEVAKLIDLRREPLIRDPS